MLYGPRVFSSLDTCAGKGSGERDMGFVLMIARLRSLIELKVFRLKGRGG